MGTALDVARLANVSVSTVSHVVNGTRKVRPETLRRVLAAIESTHYRPNTVARALRRATTDSVGFIAADIGNPHFTSIVREIEMAARRAGRILLLANSDDDPGRELEAARVLTGRRVDGLIISLTPSSGDDVIPFLLSLETPTVLIDRATTAPMDQVLVENVESTAQLVGHLIKLGHRRIGLVAGVPGISTTEERIEGWRRAHIIAGLPQDEALVVYGYSRMDPARVAAEELMSLPNPPTGIAAANNTMTIGVLRGLEAHGFRVPDDIALVAFDDFEWADLFEPRLTVIAQPTADIAKQAMRLLLSRIADPSEQPRMVRIKPKFVHRHSCGCVDLPASSPQLRPRQSVQV